MSYTPPSFAITPPPRPPQGSVAGGFTGKPLPQAVNRMSVPDPSRPGGADVVEIDDDDNLSLKQIEWKATYERAMSKIQEGYTVEGGDVHLDYEGLSSSAAPSGIMKASSRVTPMPGYAPSAAVSNIDSLERGHQHHDIAYDFDVINHQSSNSSMGALPLSSHGTGGNDFQMNCQQEPHGATAQVRIAQRIEENTRSRPPQSFFVEQQLRQNAAGGSARSLYVDNKTNNNSNIKPGHAMMTYDVSPEYVPHSSSTQIFTEEHSPRQPDFNIDSANKSIMTNTLSGNTSRGFAPLKPNTRNPLDLVTHGNNTNNSLPQPAGSQVDMKYYM